MLVTSLGQSARVAADTFRTFKEGKPDLIPIGIPPIDEVIGGFFKGTTVILAARTGVGKSRLALTAGICNAENGYKTGKIEVEDPEDVVGCRALAWASRIDSLKIRRKDLTQNETKQLEAALPRLDELDDKYRLRYNIGGEIDEVLQSVRDLAEEGCRVVQVDYIQKIRASASSDRRNEVAYNFTRLQRTFHECGVVGVVVSQCSRGADPKRPLTIHDLKESGDLENEARMIVLLDQDPVDHRNVFGRVAKSTYGGLGVRFRYRTDVSGNLALINDQPSEEEDEF
jgi:replicative DNA helicase